MDPAKRPAERGSALLVTTLAMFVMMTLSGAMLSASLLRHATERKVVESEHAFVIAEAGLDLALFELRSATDSGGDGIGTASGAIDGGVYTVEISPEFTGPGEYTLFARGTYNRRMRSMELIVSSSGGGIGYGLFGRKGIRTSGGFTVDSYDSSRGNYRSQVGPGGYAGSDAKVGSNTIIDLGGGIIHGDATPGPAGLVTAPEKVTGSTAPAQSPFLPDPYVYEPPPPGVDEGPLRPWKGSAAWSGGTFHFLEMNLSGGATIEITGDVVLYVDEKLTLTGGSQIVIRSGGSLVIHHGSADFKVSGGGIVNENEVPSKLRIQSATTSRVEISGGSSFYGAVYAPDAEFFSSGGAMPYGAVLVRKATLSGSGRLSVDEGLDSFGSSGGAGNANFEVKAALRR